MSTYSDPLELRFAAKIRDLERRLAVAEQQLAWFPATDAWTPYAPLWTSTGTAPNVGTGGTLAGYYSKVGRLVTARIAMEGGPATTFGSGDYSFTLPLTAAVNGIAARNFAHVGTWAINDSGVAYYSVTAMISQNSPTVVQGFVSGTASFFGATQPASWTTNSSFVCTITYESAS